MGLGGCSQPRSFEDGGLTGVLGKHGMPFESVPYIRI